MSRELPEPIRRRPLDAIGAEEDRGPPRSALAPLGATPPKPRKLEPFDASEKEDKRRRRKKKSEASTSKTKVPERSASTAEPEEDLPQMGEAPRSRISDVLGIPERESEEALDDERLERRSNIKKEKGERKRDSLRDIVERRRSDEEEEDEEETIENLRQRRAKREERFVEEEDVRKPQKKGKNEKRRKPALDSDDEEIEMSEPTRRKHIGSENPEESQRGEDGREDESSVRLHQYTSLSRNIPSSRYDAAFVENPLTGGFKRVGSVSNREEKRKKAIELQRDVKTSAERFAEGLAKFFTSFFLFCQGTLAGFALFLFLVAYVRYGGDISFLQVISPIALDLERSFVVLSCVSLIGACDKFMKDRMADWRDRGVFLRLVDSAIVLSYFLCFVLSLFAVPIEEQLYFSNQRSPGWFNVVQPTTEFSSSLATWHGLNIARTFCALLGWLIVTFETKNYAANESNRKLFSG